MHHTRYRDCFLIIEIADHVGIHAPKPISTITNVCSLMTLPRHLRQPVDAFLKLFNKFVGGRHAIWRDVMPDLEKINSSLRLNEDPSHPALLLRLPSSRSSRKTSSPSSGFPLRSPSANSSSSSPGSKSPKDSCC